MDIYYLFLYHKLLNDLARVYEYKEHNVLF